MRKKLFLGMTLTLSLVIGFTGVGAEIEKIITKVGGLICPTCSFALEKRIKKVEGSSRNSIDIATGDVALFPKKNVLATPEDFKKMLSAFKKATKEAGFTFGEKIRVRAQGTVAFTAAKNEFRLQLNKTHMMILYKMTDAHKKTLRDAIQQRKSVEVEGEVHKHKDLPFGLSVESIKLVDDAKKAAS